MLRQWRRPEHGTNAGYLAHRRLGEEACGPCKLAHAEYEAAARAKHGATRRELGPAHGTRAAYERERRAFKAGTGPEPCAKCKAANRERTKSRRKASA